MTWARCGSRGRSPVEAERDEAVCVEGRPHGLAQFGQARLDVEARRAVEHPRGLVALHLERQVGCEADGGGGKGGGALGGAGGAGGVGGAGGDASYPGGGE